MKTRKCLGLGNTEFVALYREADKSVTAETSRRPKIDGLNVAFNCQGHVSIYIKVRS